MIMNLFQISFANIRFFVIFTFRLPPITNPGCFSAKSLSGIHFNAFLSASLRDNESKSACGAKYFCILSTRIAFPFGNYLRVRGEYSVPTGKKILKKELPPRARRILRSRVSRLLARGTTSACAENTENLWPSMVGNRNYLRVRGEYIVTE